MRMSLESNIRAVERDLSDAARNQVPFAVSVAMNETASDLIELNKRHMRRTFNRPTRWTLNAFHFRRATKRRLVVTVERKLAWARRDYLLRQEEGGTRRKTGLERRLAVYADNGYILPVKGARRNMYGNMAPGHVQQILSALRAQGDHHQNETVASAKRKAGGRAARYFTPKPGSKLSPGVYSRKGKAKPVKVLAFTKSAPRYSKRFRFLPTMQRASDRILPVRFERSMVRAWAGRRR
jgi:hypothetical protein